MLIVCIQRKSSYDLSNNFPGLIYNEISTVKRERYKSLFGEIRYKEMSC